MTKSIDNDKILISQGGIKFLISFEFNNKIRYKTSSVDMAVAKCSTNSVIISVVQFTFPYH